MRVVVILAWLCAVASADPPTLRPPKASYPPAALRSFMQGMVKAQVGLEGDAYSAFLTSADASPQANTYWNLGVLVLRSDAPVDALPFFKQSLELSTGADRAEVEKLIKQLESAKGRIVIGGHNNADFEPAGIILMDGVLLGPSPQTVAVDTEEHLFERFTATGYGNDTYDTQPGALHDRSIETNRQPGNVFIHGLGAQSWKEGKRSFETGRRFTLPVGHHKLTVPDGYRPCSSFEVDVKSTRDITYVSVLVEDKVDEAHGCRRIKRVSQQILRLP